MEVDVVPLVPLLRTAVPDSQWGCGAGDLTPLRDLVRPSPTVSGGAGRETSLLSGTFSGPPRQSVRVRGGRPHSPGLCLVVPDAGVAGRETRCRRTTLGSDEFGEMAPENPRPVSGIGYLSFSYRVVGSRYTLCLNRNDR